MQKAWDRHKQDEEEDNLHSLSLKFRILRQHDYCVSQGISNFPNKTYRL